MNLEELNLTKEQKEAFNYGFVNLSIEDSIILLDLSLEEFNKNFLDFYNKGNSFCKYETLRKIFDKSNSLELLRQYGDTRGFFNYKSYETPKEPISTTELLDKLRGKE